MYVSSAGRRRPVADALAATLAELASLSAPPADVTEVVHVACERARAIFGVDGTVVLLSRDGTALEVAGSSGDVGDLERALSIAVAPCRIALVSGRIVAYRRESEESTYAEYTAAAAAAGVERVLSVPLRRDRGTFGTLTLVRLCAQDFTPWEHEAAHQLAGVVAAAIVHGEELAAARAATAQLEHALQARVVVEQAKGMVAAELGVSISAALEILRGFARRERLRLAEVSQLVVERELPMGVLRTA